MERAVNFLENKGIAVDNKTRIYEDLLIMHKEGVLELTVHNILLKYTENFLNVHIRLLKKIETNLTGALDYLGFTITTKDRVYYKGKEIAFRKKDSDEFLLLKLLVEKKGSHLSGWEVYQTLGYTPKRNKVNEFHPDARTRSGAKTIKKTPINRKYSQQFQACKKRLLDRIGDDKFKITSTQKEGVKIKM